MKRSSSKSSSPWLWALGLSAAALATSVWRNRRGSYELTNRTVLITGASRGLGLVLARRAVAEGARVAICARDEAELARARQNLLGYGGTAQTVLALSCDLTDPQDVQRLVREVEVQLGPIDVLVNNAGVIIGGPLENMDARDFEEAMNTHFWAPFHTMQAVLPSMKQAGEGRIVNISSLGGKVAIPHLAAYSASKFALTGLSEGFRAELGQYGIYVTTVCPGLMRTGSAENADFKGKHEKEYAWFAVADALPGFTMSAEQAARRIWNAMRRGDGELILSLPAKLLAGLHGVAPGTTTDLLAWVNRALPATGESAAANERRKGYESESPVTRSFLTKLNREEAARNNENFEKQQKGH